MTASTRLRRPLPLSPALVAELRRELTLEEVGALVIVAMDWWPEGQFPRSTYRAMQVLDVRRDTARRMVAVLRPYFAASATLALLRAAHIAKARRRAKGAVAATRARMAKRAERGVETGSGS